MLNHLLFCVNEKIGRQLVAKYFKGFDFHVIAGTKTSLEYWSNKATTCSHKDKQTWSSWFDGKTHVLIDHVGTKTFWSNMNGLKTSSPNGMVVTITQCPYKSIAHIDNVKREWFESVWIVPTKTKTTNEKFVAYSEKLMGIEVGKRFLVVQDGMALCMLIKPGKGVDFKHLSIPSPSSKLVDEMKQMSLAPPKVIKKTMGDPRTIKVLLRSQHLELLLKELVDTERENVLFKMAHLFKKRLSSTDLECHVHKDNFEIWEAIMKYILSSFPYEVQVTRQYK